MKKALRQLKRLTASFLCLLMVVGALDFSVFAKENTEGTDGDPPIQYIEEDPPIQYTEEDSTFVLARSNVSIFDEDYFPATADLQEAEAYADSQTATARAGDLQVQRVQKWLNQNYKSALNEGGVTVSVDGITGGNTVKGLLCALQSELRTRQPSMGIEVDGAWGEKTAAAYEKYILSYGSKNSLVPILQCALWCKGYSPGYDNVHEVDGIVSYEDDFDENIQAAIISLKTDAYGSTAQNGTVTVNVMKALMSMDSFQRINGGEETIREFQQYLNRTYEDYAGLSPCDGVYSANTNRALIRSLQKEVGLPLDKTDGIFGTDTRDVCPEIPYSKNSSAARKFSGDPNVKGPYYTSDEIGRFTKLLQFALYVNGSNNIVFDGVFGSATSQAIQSFQEDYSLSITGTANPTTWMSLLSSNGDPDRPALGLDCATILDDAKVKALYNRGYRYVGRYLTGTYDGGKSKALTVEEANSILNNGMRFFPIYQTSANYAGYFTKGKGTSDAKAAIEAAMALGIPKDTIIYFAVDFDTMDYQVTNLILPYFQEVHEVMSQSIYRTGIYGTRNTCSRVAAAGYTCSSFVGDMSSGFSGNLGYKIPEDWAFDQFFTVKNDTDLGFEIDKDAVSGRDQGVSYLEASSGNNDDYEIDFGKPYSDTLKGPTVNIAGLEFSLFSFDVGFDLGPLSESVEVKHDQKKDTIQIIFGKDLNDSDTLTEAQKNEEFRKAYAEAKELVSLFKSDRPAFNNRFNQLKQGLISKRTRYGFDMDACFSGYLTVKASTGDVKEGGAVLFGSVGASASIPFAPFPLLYLKFTVGGSVSTGIKLIFEDSNIQPFINAGISTDLGLGIELNLLVASAYAGIKGGLDCNFTYPAATMQELMEVELNASVFLEWSVLMWGNHYEQEFARWRIYPTDSSDSKSTVLSISSNDLKFIEPLPQTALASSAPGVFRQNMQIYCLPQIISLGNGKMLMAYIEDEGDTTKRISQNRTKLMYSIYDGSSWNEPQPVLDDGTVDFEPVIAPDGNGGAHILWQNGSTTFGSDVTLDEMAAGIDLYYTHWNGSTFDNTTAITSNNQRLEMGYKIASSGNNLSVVWQENTENDTFGLNGTNSIYRKQFVNGAWGSQETLSSGLGIINSLDTTYIGSNDVVAYTATPVGSSDINDLELYYFNGTSATRLTNNNIPDYSADFWNNELYWIGDNSIFSITNGSISTKTTVAENIGVNVPQIKVIGNNSGEKSIVWEHGTDGGLNFYGIHYNTATGSFGSVQPLSTTSGVIRGWDACMLPNGQVEMVYCFAEPYEEPVDERLYGQLDLMQTSADSFYDIAVDTQAAYEGEIAGGQEITVYANVYNTGSAPVSQFDVKITYNGGTVETLTVDQSLAVGESAELEIPFTLPSTISRRDYQVEILPVGGDDVSPADNKTTLSIGFADLALEDISEVWTSSGRQLKVTVKNNGFSTSSAGTLELLRDGSEGSVYSSRTVRSLSPGASATYVFNIAQRDLDGDISESLRTFYLSLESETEESDYGNNSEIVQMYPDYSISLTAGTGGSVSGAGRYAYDSTATITATPQLGYMFDGWYEDGQRLHGLNATCELQVIASRTLEARFKPNNLSITNIEPYGVFDDEDNPMIFTAFTTGGQGALSYQFYVYQNGSQIYTTSSSTDNFFTRTLSSAQTYSITVEVMDSTGYTVRGTTYYDGQNWYMDDYGDNFEDAYNWRISSSGNDSIDGTFTSTNDVDVIKFTAPATGTYQIYSSGISTNYLQLVSQSISSSEPIDTKLNLYDSSYNLIEKSINFYDLVAGRVYYIKFENPKQIFAGAYNTYTIHVSRSTVVYSSIVSSEYPLVFRDGQLLSIGTSDDYNSNIFKIENVGNGYCTISVDKETIYNNGNYYLVDLPEPLYLTFPGESDNPYGPNVAGLVYMRPYTGDSTQKWIIKRNGDYIQPASNPSYCFALNTQMPRPFAANIVRYASSNEAHFNFVSRYAAPVETGNYRIQNAGSGLYLGATDTGITQNWAGDIWNVQQDGGYYVISSNARSAQVLTYNETTGKVESATDTADENQRWAITRGADGTIRLSPKSDIGNIMAVENASVDASAAIVLQEDGLAANGKWIVEDITSTPTEESGIIPDGVYEIQDITSGKLIQAESGSLGAVAHLWESAGTDNQKLDFAYQNDGTYKITVLSSDNVLTVPASSSNNGVQLQFYAWNGGDHQRWYVVDIGGGFFKLINKYSGLVVDISENGIVNGTKIQQWQDTGAPAQMFRLLPDDPVTSMELNDGVYELQGKTSGKLIHSASGAPGSIAHLWEDANTDNQRLRFERQDDDTYKITVLSSGSVLTARDAGTGNGVQLDFSAWTDGDHQKWYVVDCGGGYVKLINKHSRLAIDISENGTANGTKVQQWEDTGADAQRFRLLPTTLPSASMDLDNGLYQIQGKTSGKLIDAAGWSNGTVAHLWESAGTTNQKMNFERQSDGTYKITVYDGEKALTDPSSYGNGAQLLFWDWNGSDQQKWYVVDCGNGYVKFINKFSGQAIDISENGTENGTKIQQWQDTGADAQRFHLIPVSN